MAAAIALGDYAEPVSGAYDQVSYDVLAQRVLDGHGFSFPVPWYPFTESNEQTAHWSFAYTLYLSGVYALFGHHPLAARLIQALLSGFAILLIYRIGRRLFGERVGLAAAGLTASYAYLIFFNAALMTQTFYILALLASIEIALDISNSPRHRVSRFVLLGLALGLGALMRQTILLFAPLLFGYVWFSIFRTRTLNSPPFCAVKPRPTLGRFAFHVSISVTVMALLILPWTVRNYLVYDDFLLLNSNSGFWFYSSNHPNQGTSFDPNYVAAIPDDLKGLPEPSIDRALLRKALDFIRDEPSRFILLSINRMKDYFWLFPSEQSSLISNISRLFSFTLYLPFMVYGLYLSRSNWRACLPLYLYAALDTGLSLISWSAPRYRLPSDSLMMVFAGLAIVTLAERLGLSKWLTNHSAIQNLQSEN